MKKKPIQKQPVKRAVSLPTKSRKEALSNDVHILKKSISKKPISAPSSETVTNLKPETEIENETIYQSTDAINGNNVDSPNTVNSDSKETINTVDVDKTGSDIKPPLEEKELSLWDDLKSPTEQDALIKDKIPVNENSESSLFDDMANKANGTEQQYSEDEAKKQTYKVKASIIVELMDVLFMIICTCITWDFTDENQKRFSLLKERKKAIEVNLYQLYVIQGKKVDPKKSIWILILGSYAPMLIVAVMIFFNNMKNRKKKKEEERIEQQRRRSEEAERMVIEHKGGVMIEKSPYELELERKIKFMEDQNKNTPNDLRPKEKTAAEKRAEKLVNKRPMYLHTEIKDNMPKKRGRKAGVKIGSYNKNK